MDLERLHEMGKQAGTLKANHPAAWAVGEELAAEALATRSPDLIRMTHERGKEGNDAYRQQVTEAIITAINAGEIEFPEPVTQEVLVAVAISCGMKLIDALDAEARRR